MINDSITQQNKKRRALCAMSGGVDSTVAALLTVRAGYDCIGAMMKLYDGGCAAECEKATDGVADAKEAAMRMGISFCEIDFQDIFREMVIDRFAATYKSGHTPNPCVDCNRGIKFGALLQHAVELGCDAIVTGHYARIDYDTASGRYLLKKGADVNKDQSYVLYTLTQHQLGRTLFPLGGLTKPQVREIAESSGFTNAAKNESQDICFVPDGDYSRFIEGYTGIKNAPGSFVDGSGNVLGAHKGIVRYTIGQRKGLGISSSEPLYVREKRIDNNTVVLSRERELYSKSLIAKDINLIACEKLDAPIRVTAKIRYKQAEQSATVYQLAGDMLHVEFAEPQRAVAAGQAVVLYDGDIVVGGGTISEASF